MENAIQRKVSGIVLTAANAQALIPVSKRALAAGIPVINDDVLLQSDDATMKISENSLNVGRMLADFLVRRVNGKGNVVMLKGPAGADLFAQRAKGAKDEFARYPGIKVIAEQWHPSNVVEATRVMENFLQAHGQKISAVWTGNTTQACVVLPVQTALIFCPWACKKFSITRVASTTLEGCHCSAMTLMPGYLANSSFAPLAR